MTLYCPESTVRVEVLGDELRRLRDAYGLRRRGSFEARFTILKMLESRATALVSFEPLMIPGLLQTVPYAQATFREVGLIDIQDAEVNCVEVNLNVAGFAVRDSKNPAPFLTFEQPLGDTLRRLPRR